MTDDNVLTRQAQERLAAIAREISALDLAALVQAAPKGTWEEDLAVETLAYKRRLREKGVFVKLAMVAHAQRQKEL